MTDFDDLIADTRAITMDMRFDFIDYLKRTNDAPVRSLSEIIAKGLFDKQLEARHKSADTVQSRDSEGHKRVVARQANLRARMIAFMDSAKLDAIAYPRSGSGRYCGPGAVRVELCVISAIGTSVHLDAGRFYVGWTSHCARADGAPVQRCAARVVRLCV